MYPPIHQDIAKNSHVPDRGKDYSQQNQLKQSFFHTCSYIEYSFSILPPIFSRFNSIDAGSNKWRHLKQLQLESPQ